MNIDIIILSNAKSEYHRQLTVNCINSLLTTKSDYNFVIHVAEGNKRVDYDYGTTYHYSCEFNYNKIINKLLPYCKSQYICFCNNDLIFHDYWADNLIKYMKMHGCLSGSPNEPYVINLPNEYEIGYELRRQIAGWCILADKKVFKAIGKLDETYLFWRSDKAYVDQLKTEGIKHIITQCSNVEHINDGGATYKTEPHSVIQELTTGQQQKYIKLSNLSLDIVCASHNEKTLKENLLKTNTKPIIQRGYSNVSKAYNNAKTTAKYIMYCHHDIWFGKEFIAKVKELISYANEIDKNWGVLGFAGVTEMNEKRGYILDRGKPFGKSFEGIQEVQTLDELAIIVKANDNIKFDERLKNHLYAVDICLAMRDKGRKNYVISAFLHHNAWQNDYSLSKDFYEQFEIIKSKYKKPIATTCIYEKKN